MTGPTTTPFGHAGAPDVGSGSFAALQGWSLPRRSIQTLGRPRFRLEGTLLALHPDTDETAWTVEDPGVLRHWSITSGQEFSRIPLSECELLWAFAPSGNLLASAGEDWSLWRRDTAELLLSRKVSSWTTVLAFHPRSFLLATGHDDGVVRLWETQSGRLCREWPTHAQPISALAFNPEGSRLCAASEQRDLFVWDVGTGMGTGCWTGHTDRISGVAWHRDGNHLFSAAWDSTVRVWNATTGQTIAILNGHANQVLRIASAPSGRYVVTADQDQVLWLWDPFKIRALRRWRCHSAEVNSLAFTPDSRRILSGGADGRLSVWDVYTGKNLFRSPDSTHAVTRLSISPGGSQVASLAGGNSLRLWNLRHEPASCESLPLTSEATAVSHSPDGQWLATGHAGGQVQLWNRRSLRPIPAWHLHQTKVTALAFSPSRPVLASTGGDDGYVYLWSLKDGSPLLLIPESAQHSTVETIAFVPNSPWFLAAGIDWLGAGGNHGTIQLWDLQRPGPITHAPFPVRQLRVHPSGDYFIAGLTDDSWGIFETRTLRMVRELAGPTGTTAALAISADGNWLATADDDGHVRLWSLPAGRLEHLFDLDSPVRDLMFRGNSLQLLTANANGTICLLDLSSDLGQ